MYACYLKVYVYATDYMFGTVNQTCLRPIESASHLHNLLEILVMTTQAEPPTCQYHSVKCYCKR